MAATRRAPGEQLVVQAQCSAMHGRMKLWVVLGAALLASACTTGPARVGEHGLPAAVHQALDRLALPAEALAFAALPLDHTDPRWQHRAELPMQPGSAMKLVTTAVALDRLGPNLRGFTELRSAAPVAQGVLQGPLVLRGGADAELDVPAFWALLLELRQQGITHIAGDLLLDRTRWRPARPDLGQPPFDDATEFAYNVIPDALHLAGGLLPLALHEQGGAVQAASVPPLDGLVVDASAMTLTDGRCAAWSAAWLPATVREGAETTRLELAGGFPRGCSARTALQVLDRDELAARLFATLWRGLGGQWQGRLQAVATPQALPADTRLLARRQARPWGELLRHLNKASDNAWTRLLYMEIGVAAQGEAETTPTAELAAREVQRWFAEQGIPADGLVLDNGSGLSRSERISALQLAQLIQAVWRGRHAPEFLMSLPVAGVDGSMRNRLKDSPAAGWARLKTGTLRNVVALAGVVRDPQGRPWALAAMVNHDTLAARSRPVLDALVDHIAREGVPTGGSTSRPPRGAGGERR